MRFYVQGLKKLGGFTLPEVLLALSFSSLIMLGAAKTYPQLQQQVNRLNQHYRLEHVMRQAVFVIEKDLRRAGFCRGQCQGKSVNIDHKNTEPRHSCVILAYDVNRNGQWEPPAHAKSEYFGYRLNKNTLEGARGVSHCQGSDWEKLLDPTEITLTHFSITHHGHSTKKNVFLLALHGHWTREPSLSRQIRLALSAPNV